MGALEKIYRKRSGERGQTITEFLFLLVLLIAVVLLHTQLSLTYVIAHFMKYTTFMTARAQEVGGNSALYREALVGNSTQSKLSPVATIAAPEGDSYITEEGVRIDYSVSQFVPWVETTPLQRRSETQMAPQPGRLTGGHYDNE